MAGHPKSMAALRGRESRQPPLISRVDGKARDNPFLPRTECGGKPQAHQAAVASHEPADCTRRNNRGWGRATFRWKNQQADQSKQVKATPSPVKIGGGAHSLVISCTIMCSTTKPVFETETASAQSGIGIGNRIGAFLGVALTACLAVLGKIGVAIVRNAGAVIGAIVSFIAIVAWETLVACRYFVIAAVAVMAMLWFWGQGSRDLGSKPADVGFFEGLFGHSETHGGVRVFQTVWGKTYTGIPYLGWRDVTADVERQRAIDNPKR